LYRRLRLSGRFGLGLHGRFGLGLCRRLRLSGRLTVGRRNRPLVPSRFGGRLVTPGRYGGFRRRVTVLRQPVEQAGVGLAVDRYLLSQARIRLSNQGQVGR